MLRIWLASQSKGESNPKQRLVSSGGFPQKTRTNLQQNMHAIGNGGHHPQPSDLGFEQSVFHMCGFVYTANSVVVSCGGTAPNGLDMRGFHPCFGRSDSNLLLPLFV